MVHGDHERDPGPHEGPRVRSWVRDANDPYAPDIGLVGLERGPGGDVFVTDIATAIASGGSSTARDARARGDVTSGASPLPVTFDASGTTVPDGESVAGYDWDFDGDGVVDVQTTTATVNHVYPAKGVQRARVTVHYADGDEDTSDEVPVLVDPPQSVEVTAPGDPSAVRWSVGETIPIAGSAEAGGSGDPLAASQLEWSLVIRHCEEDGNCHSHQADSQLSGLGAGNTGAAGTLSGPDHAYPSHLELRLTARDPLDPQLATSATVRLDPETVKLLVTSDPPGRTLSANTRSGAGPILCEVIRGSLTTVAAAISESAGGRTFEFDGWSDGGEPSHSLTPEEDATLTARYVVSPAVVTAPALGGVPEAGRALTTGGEAFDGSPGTTVRRWERCGPGGGDCREIPGATDTSLTLSAQDVGARLRAVVTRTNRAGSATATSVPSAVVAAPGVPAPRTAPTTVRRGPPVRAERDGRVPLRLRCPGPGTCRVLVRLALDAPGRAIVLGSVRGVRIAAKRSVIVHVRLTATARRLLVRRRSLRVRSTVTAGPGTPVVTRFTLLAPRRR